MTKERFNHLVELEALSRNLYYTGRDNSKYIVSDVYDFVEVMRDKETDEEVILVADESDGYLREVTRLDNYPYFAEI